MTKKAQQLRALLQARRLARGLGAHDAVSAILGERHGFDLLWASGLGISVSHGLPDAGLLTMTELLNAATTIDRSTSLPVIVDCDSGFGERNVVARTAREYSMSGIAAISLEDKEFPKRNSFTSGGRLADRRDVAARITVAKGAAAHPDFVVVARVESLVLRAGMADAIGRALCYRDAGADALLIHSKAAGPEEILDFVQQFRERDPDLPIIVIPTTYVHVTTEALELAGVNVVIYANQALRAGLKAMDEVIRAIRALGCTGPVEDAMASLDELLALTGTSTVDETWGGAGAAATVRETAVDASTDAVSQARGLATTTRSDI